MSPIAILSFVWQHSVGELVARSSAIRQFGARGAPMLVFLVGMGGAALGARAPLNVYDEGLVLTAAERILRGEVPHLDFWRIYPPGQSAAFALVLSVTNHSLLSVRLLDAVVRACLSLLMYLLGRRLAGGKVGLALGLAGAFMLASPTGTPVHSAIALCLASLYALAVSIDATAGEPRKSRHAAFLGGLLLVVAATFRTDFAAYCFLGVTIAAGATFAQAGSSEMRQHARARLTRFLIVSGSGVAAFLATAVLVCGFQATWEQYIHFPLVGMRSARWLAYPDVLQRSGGWLLFYPLLLALIGLFALWTARLVLDRSPAGQDTLKIAILGFSGFTFLQALSRFDHAHTLPCALLTLVAIGVSAGPNNTGPGVVSRGILLLIGIALAFPFVRISLASVPGFTQNQLVACDASVSRSRCVAVSADQSSAVTYIQSLTRESDRIFVGVTRHDRVFIGDSSFYYLAGRLPATKYDEVHPGVTDQAQVQRAIVDDLAEGQTPWVVLFDAPVSQEPNLSARSSGVTILDEYLATNYRVEARFGRYSIARFHG